MKEERYGLALCAGLGLLELGIHAASPTSRTVCYVENGAYAASCLVANMERGWLCPAPIWDDLRTFDGRIWRGAIDFVSAGYPCQPFSDAGKKLGEDDPRHLWPDVARIVAEVEPGLCFFENVSGHLKLGFEKVYRDLRELGYVVEAEMVAASEVGAPHRRKRLFILAAHPDRVVIRHESERATAGRNDVCAGGETLARNDGADGGAAVTDADRERLQAEAVGSGGGSQAGRRLVAVSGTGQDVAADANGRRRETRLARRQSKKRHASGKSGAADSDRQNALVRSRFWRDHSPPEPTICRVDDGVSEHVERLRALGNGVVRYQATAAYLTIAARMGVDL